MTNEFTIPAHGELDYSFAQPETRVKLTLEIEGGTVPEDEVVVITVPKIILTKPGQLHLEFDRNEDFDWESTWVAGGHWEERTFELQLDKALLRTDRHDDATHYIEVKKKEAQNESQDD